MSCPRSKASVLSAGLGLLLLFAPIATKATGVWTRIESPNFEFIGNASDADIRKVAMRLERFRSTLRSVFPQFRAVSGKRTRVLVFRDDASFRPFKPKRADGAPDDFIGAFYQAGEDFNYVAVSVEGEAAGSYGTIFHEYVHEILNANLGSSEVPAWLNEGLAEYFQTFRTIDDRSAAFGSIQTGHIQRLKRGALMPWDQFFKLDANSLLRADEQSRALFYAQAWAVTHFLIDRKLAPALQSSNRTESVIKALQPTDLVQDAAAIDRTTLDQGVGTFAGNAVSMGEIVISSDLVPVTAPGSVISQATADAYLGDLLYHLSDNSNAEALLLGALKAEPGLAMANASLGLIRLRQRKFDEARRLLELASAADQKNHLVHFYYAYLLSRENTDEFGSVTSFPAASAAKMRAALKRAIAIEPNHAESYKLLALIGVVTGEDLDEALQSAQKALSLEPGNQEFAITAAQLMLRKERIPEARAIAEKLLRSAPAPYVKSEAESVIRTANAFDASKRSTESLLVNVRADEAPPPLILQRKDLTDEQVARIDLDREISNLNKLIPRPKTGEQQVVGTIDAISCSDDSIQYRVRSGDGVLRLTSSDFDNVSMRVLLDGTHSFTFRCNARFSDVLAVMVYRPNARPFSDGVLRSIAFVPNIFKLRSLEELARERQIIIEGRPPTDLKANAAAADSEQADFERQTRDTQIKNIEARLRQSEDGERRLVGVPEKFDCADGKFVLTLKSGGSLIVFKADIERKFLARSLTPETGPLEVGCRSTLPTVNAVVTYRENAGGEKEFVAIEFVPSGFKLP